MIFWILFKPEVYERINWALEVGNGANFVYALGEGFGTQVLETKLKRTWFGKKKYYKVKFESYHSQKYVVDLFKNYFCVF